MARFLLHLIRNEPFFVRASASKLVQCSKKDMAVVTLIFVFVVYFVDNVMCGCNIFVGPSGGTDCVLLKPFFTEYQYATCLTDSYIRARSGRRHRCISPLATYCYYQCMLELNNIDAGRSIFIFSLNFVCFSLWALSFCCCWFCLVRNLDGTYAFKPSLF